MILRIIFWIFDNYFGSFRDTWISDDSGVFRDVFRIHDLTWELVFPIALLPNDQEKYLLPYVSFLFPFLYFFLHKPKHFHFPKIPFFLQNFHQLPPTTIKCIPFLSLPWPAKWPKGVTPHASLICTKPLPIYTNFNPFTKSKPYLNFPFTFHSTFFSTSTKRSSHQLSHSSPPQP